jgi:Rrf2 family protein
VDVNHRNKVDDLMISQTTEYALRAVVYLAQHPSESWTTRQIAAATRVPAGYLSKVLQGLSRSGLITSQRGRHGGFQLTGDPAQLTVLQVINAVEPIRRIHSCPLKLTTHDGGLCPLHKRLDETIEQVENSFRNTTVLELLGSGDSPEPLCEFPRGTQFTNMQVNAQPVKK